MTKRAVPPPPETPPGYTYDPEEDVDSVGQEGQQHTS